VPEHIKYSCNCKLNCTYDTAILQDFGCRDAWCDTTSLAEAFPRLFKISLLCIGFNNQGVLATQM
jgi:hypothetical protein